MRDFKYPLKSHKGLNAHTIPIEGAPKQHLLGQAEQRCIYSTRPFPVALQSCSGEDCQWSSFAERAEKSNGFSSHSEEAIARL